MITILRMGHRKDRDHRASMHVALVGRALGADRIIFCGEQDDALVERVNGISRKWGGNFSASYSQSYRKTLRHFKGTKVHLTMYGEPLEKKAGEVRKKRQILVAVGSEKVPRDVYEMCDYNIAATNQPHSEIAALALFLRECKGQKTYAKKFPRAKVRVFPSKNGKCVKSYK